MLWENVLRDIKAIDENFLFSCDGIMKKFSNFMVTYKRIKKKKGMGHPERRQQANSYKVVFLAQLSDFLSTRDCQIFCLRIVKKKKLTLTTSK